MALSLFQQPSAPESAVQPFRVDDHAAPYLGVYRCPGCGDEIAHDSLAVSCRCSEECYSGGGTALPH